MEALLRKFHFAHIKAANSGNFIMFVNDCGRFSLSFRKNYINKVLKVGLYLQLKDVVLFTLPLRSGRPLFF